MKKVKPHHRRTLPPLEPVVAQNPKTGDFSLAPLGPTEEEASRTRLVQKTDPKTGKKVWEKKHLELPELKVSFDQHRCTFGLPRWNTTETNRSTSVPPSLARTCNSLLPDPLLCSTPDPSLAMYTTTNHGFPSVRRQQLEHKLRKGVHIEDVAACDYLPARSPYFPLLTPIDEDEEEHREQYLQYHRKRRQSEDSERGGDRMLRFKPGVGLHVLLTKPQVYTTKKSQACAVMVEQSIARERARRQAKKLKRTLSIADVTAEYVPLAQSLQKSLKQKQDEHIPPCEASTDDGREEDSGRKSQSHHHCDKKCPQCLIVEGLVEDFETHWKTLTDKRYQEEVLQKLRRSGGYT